MSIDESTKSSQSPGEEALDRAAEFFPGVLLPRLVGVKHLLNTLGDSRQRVRDSHKVQHAVLKRTMGTEDSEEGGSEDEDMEAGITVAGDTNITIRSGAEEGSSPPTKPGSTSSGGIGKTLMVAALAAAAGGAAPLLWSHLNAEEVIPAVTSAANDWALGLQVKEEP